MNQQRLGPYELQSVLGRGGMGTVYRAVDSNSGQTVAVKALAPTLSLDEHFRLRFESEIATMTKMDHPNIVRILGYGQDEGNLFFAMEIVEGKSLFALQKDGVLFDWRQVLQISLNVCAGLQHAHNRGIIHRDLKPGNLVRETSGNVKITDFGIAKTFGSSALTGEGGVVGTMDFMAPEQAKGHKVTPRSDMYSLGAVMYTLLSRRPPLKGETLEQTIRNLTSVKPVSIRKLVPSVPREFAAVIHRLLEKDPQKRFATSLALSKYLVDLQTHLRDHAEAKTESSDTDNKTRAISRGDQSVDSEFAINPKANDASVTASKGVFGTRRLPAVVTAAAEPETREIRLEELPLPVPQPDFYSPVPRIVSSSDDGTESTRAWGIVPLALALLAVLAVLVVGLYFAFRRPTAEDLLALIDASAASPTRAQEPMESFLKYYPEHERSTEVRQLSEIADAIRFRNIMNRRNIETLKPMERQFMELTDFDSPGDYKKLLAMITLYEANEGLDPMSGRILAAAKAYSVKFKLDVEREKSLGRQRIQNALDSCDKASPDDARNICDSVILLYGDQQWAQDLIYQAREKLEFLPPK